MASTSRLTVTTPRIRTRRGHAQRTFALADFLRVQRWLLPGGEVAPDPGCCSGSGSASTDRTQRREGRRVSRG